MGGSGRGEEGDRGGRGKDVEKKTGSKKGWSA